MTDQRMTRRALGAASLGVLAAGTAAAQDFPRRPIRFICPFPAGGIVDLVMRTFNEELAAELGQPVVIDARPGGAGVIAAQALLGAPADGHAWIMVTFSHLVAPVLARAPYHPVEDFVGLAMAAQSISIAVVPPSLPVHDMAEFIAYARANPGRLNYLRPGSGSYGHLANEALKQRHGLDIVGVDYRGLPQGVVDLIAERIQFGLVSSTLVLNHIREGRLRAIGVSSDVRAPELPELKTFEEQGIGSTGIGGWYTALAPRGTPPAVVARVNAAFIKVLALPQVREKLRNAGCAVAAPIAPDALQAQLAAEYARYLGMIRTLGLAAG